MPAERNRVQEVFDGAVDLDGLDRELYLDSACAGDDELRAAVEHLLQNDPPDGRESLGLGLREVALRDRGLEGRIVSLPHTQALSKAYVRRTMSGQLVSHYEIIERIAEGGMGIVYKAKDLTLERTVAIKFLTSSLVTDENSRLRFFREAKAAAALNHPHICTVHEISEIDKDLYIVMEFIDGDDLTKRIRAGPLPLGEAVSIVIQTGEGLQAAHEQGIVHRDVKSSNIVVTPQKQAKLLDFGLAQFGQVDLSADHSVLGTPSYMSPEQVEGLAPLDSRTDIWSLGVVLYEVITAQLPFQEQYLEALKYSIVNEHPVPPISLRPEIPTEVNTVVEKALQKNPSDRYASVRDLVMALRSAQSGLAPVARPRSGPSQSSSRSIAVLPFLNMSANQENEYFADGLTEEIINALTQVRELRVVSRGSAFAFKGGSRDIQSISERLKVDAVVDGSVRLAKDRLRVTAQLIGVPEGYQLWSQKFDRSKKDVFDLQDELTRKIVESLKLKLVERRSDTFVKHYTDNLAAHEFYLQGRFHLNKQTLVSARRATHCFQEAISCSADYPLPYVGLADSHMLLLWYGLDRSDKLMAEAKKAIEKALHLDDELAAAHCVMGVIRAGYEWDWKEAEQEFLRALALGPGFSTSHFHYAMDYLTPMGQLEDAQKEIEMALQFDPLSLIVVTALGGCLFRRGKYDEAVESLQVTLAMDPTFYHAHWTLGKVFEQKQDFAKALAAFARAKELERDNPSILADLGHCYGKSGQQEKALKVLASLDEISQNTYISPLSRAVVWLGLGDTERTIECLEQAYRDRTRGLVWINVDPRFDSLHSERAFADLTTRIGLPART